MHINHMVSLTSGSKLMEIMVYFKKLRGSTVLEKNSIDDLKRCTVFMWSCKIHLSLLGTIRS